MTGTRSGEKRSGFCRLAVVAGMLAVSSHALAVPGKIVILRHGEKQDKYALCDVGRERSLALGFRYLGGNAADSVLPSEGPAALLAITLHTLETLSPVANIWGKPVVTYSAVPLPDQSDEEKDLLLNKLTQAAARDVLNNPLWEGKTVVMAWEHKRIASKSLEKDYPGEKITLRQLLNLDRLDGVPASWDGSNYDYLWIVTYGNPGSAVPTGFRMLKQVYGAPYDDLPSNDWGKKPEFPSGSECKE